MAYRTLGEPRDWLARQLGNHTDNHTLVFWAEHPGAHLSRAVYRRHKLARAILQARGEGREYVAPQPNPQAFLWSTEPAEDYSAHYARLHPEEYVLDPCPAGAPIPSHPAVASTRQGISTYDAVVTAAAFVMACIILVLIVVVVVMPFIMSTGSATSIHDAHVVVSEVVPVLQFGEAVAGGTCPAGFSEYNSPPLFLENTCLVSRPYPAAVDATLLGDGGDHQACTQFTQYACDRWMSSSTTGGFRDRGFSVIRSYVDQFLSEVRSVTYQCQWCDGNTPLMFYDSCVSSLSAGLASPSVFTAEGAARWPHARADHDRLAAQLDAVDQIASLPQLVRQWGRLAASGYVTPFKVDADVSLTNTQEMLLVVEQDGLFGATSLGQLESAEHLEMVQALLAPWGLEGRAREAVDIELLIASSWGELMPGVPPGEQTMERYISDGFYAADLRTWASLLAQHPQVQWDEFARGMDELVPGLRATIASRRVWLFKDHFFTRLDALLGTRVPLDGWRLYTKVAICFGKFAAMPSTFTRIGLNLVQRAPGLGGTRPNSRSEAGAAGATGEPEDDGAAGSARYELTADQLLLPWLKWGPSGDKYAGGPAPGYTSFQMMRAPRTNELQGEIEGKFFEWNMYNLPSDSLGTRFRDLCGELTWLQMGEEFERIFVETQIAPDWMAQLRAWAEEARTVARGFVGEWAALSGSDRAKLQAKLDRLEIRIGAPNRGTDPFWHNTTRFSTASLDENIDTVARFRFAQIMERWMAALTGVDSDFAVPTTTANAYYHPSELNIAYTAAMKGPFMDARYDLPSNFAGFVWIIAHEIFHAIDPNGIYFDDNGSFNPGWLSPAGYSTYATHTACLVDQFSGRTALGNTHDGRNTLTENFADWGAHQVVQRMWATHTAGWTEAQRHEGARTMFTAFGQSWCTRLSYHEERARIFGDVHSVPQIRVDESLHNNRLWRQTFGCSAAVPCSMFGASI